MLDTADQNFQSNSIVWIVYLTSLAFNQIQEMSSIKIGGSHMENTNKLNDKIYSLFKLSTYIIGPLIGMALWIMVVSSIMCGGMETLVESMNGFIETFTIFSIPMLLFLAVIPLIVKVKYENKSFKELGLIYTSNKRNNILLALNMVVLMVMGVRFVTLDINSGEILTMFIHILCIGVSEEIMLRSVVFDEVGSKFNKVITIIITALIFSFIYHSGSDLQSNILIRFPLGLILGFLRSKTNNVYNSIAFHTWYNMFVLTI